MTASEDQLVESLRDFAMTVCTVHGGRLERVTAFSAACKRVGDLGLVDHPEWLVKEAFDKARWMEEYR